MTTRSAEDLRRILYHRSERVVDAWYEAVKGSALAIHSREDVRAILSDIFGQVVRFLASEERSLREAESLGAAFISLRVRPDAVGSIPQVLMIGLTEDVPEPQKTTVAARLPALIAGMMSGLYRSGTQALFNEQEEIRAAYGRALRSAQDELRIKDAGIEASINAISMLGMRGRLTYVNPAFMEMWGYEDEQDVLGRHISEFGEWQGDINQTLKILSEQGGWVGELVARRADDSRFDVQASVTLIRDEVGEPSQLMVFFVDITERKRTQKALERRAAHATFLNQVGEEIYGIRTADEMLQRVVRKTQRSFGYHQVAVLTVDRGADELVAAAIAGALEMDSPERYRIPLGEGITGWVAEHGEMLVVNDVRTDVRYVCLHPGLDLTRAELAVPVSVNGEVMAVLDVQSPEIGAFEESDRDVIGTLADQLSVALENGRLYEALQQELAQRRDVEGVLRRNVRRMETLRELDEAILVAKSSKEVAEAALRHLRRLIPCERASIDVFDFDANEVVVLAATQTIGEGKASTDTRFPLTQRRLLFELLGDRQIVYVRDIRVLPQSSPLIRTLHDEGLRSFVVAPISVPGRLIGMVSLGSDREAGFRPDHQPIVEEVADLIAIALEQARLHDSIRQQGERLRDAMARLAEAEEAERRAVVRALHDRVGQNLTALDLNLSTVRSQLAGHGLDDLSSRLGYALSLVEETNERIRQLMADLRPPVLDDYGVLAALHWYADQFSTQTGIPVTVRGDEKAGLDLPAHVQNAMFRIAQEALNNVAKHAQASEASVALVNEGRTVRLIISDDGVGFEGEKPTPKKSSWGLLTMRERAESVGAEFSIRSGTEEGTRVVVEVSR